MVKLPLSLIKIPGICKSQVQLHAFLVWALCILLFCEAWVKTKQKNAMQ